MSAQPHLDGCPGVRMTLGVSRCVCQALRDSFGRGYESGWTEGHLAGLEEAHHRAKQEDLRPETLYKINEALSRLTEDLGVEWADDAGRDSVLDDLTHELGSCLLELLTRRKPRR